jgi:hypothetical protein
MRVTLEQHDKKMVLYLSSDQIEAIANLNSDTQLIINARPPGNISFPTDDCSHPDDCPHRAWTRPKSHRGY